jgi:exodeoxyribonuclease VII small subunit
MARNNDEKQEPSFEQALDRLEKIVAEMEAGKLGLEDMVARFEEGMKLVKFCRNKLDEVKQRIEKLTQKNGEETTGPFESNENAPF